MRGPRTPLPLALGLSAAFALAACGSGGSVSGGAGPGMMGDGSGMAARPGYHYSNLTCRAPRDLPGQVVTVMLGDMGMTRMMGGTAPLGARMMLRAAPRAVAAGRVSLVAANRGWRTHELVVLPLAAGQRAGRLVPGPDGKIEEEGNLGEASASCAAGTGEGIRAGAVGWMTLTLAPGHYELVCNLRNHYANGMHQEIQVG